MRLPLFYLSAFTSEPYGGNPAAVCLVDSSLDDEAMGKVATENNLPATAFLKQRGEDFELRWFTRQRELKLCGHATLAAGYVVLNLLRPSDSRVEFRSRHHGPVTVEKQDGLLAIDFPAFKPSGAAEVPADLLRALGADQAVEILQGNQTYMVVFDEAEKVQRLKPRFDVLRALDPYAVVVTAPGIDCDFVSRYFAPSFGLDEDFATGSSHCMLAPYWTKRSGKERLHAKQLSSRGGELWCEWKEDRVRLAGNAVLRMQGAMEL